MIPQHLERLTLKKPTINNIGKDWEQLELIYIYGGNVKYYIHLQKVL